MTFNWFAIENGSLIVDLAIENGDVPYLCLFARRYCLNIRILDIWILLKGLASKAKWGNGVDDLLKFEGLSYKCAYRIKTAQSPAVCVV